jgi:DNA-binding transcriptional MerR regulator
MYTVKQLSDLAGVTVRTLHHYDEIGLLKPTSIGSNGYRYYGDEALYRLQQILFYRELDLPLGDIKAMLGRRDFDVLSALQEHRTALQSETRRLRRLVGTIDRTISHLKGKAAMDPKKLFEGFSEQEQEQLAEEAAQKWDRATVEASNRKWKSFSAAEKESILAQGNAVYGDLLAVRSRGAASPQVQAVIGRWQAHLEHFWSPNDEQLLGLADLYNDDARFRANYEKTAPGLAEFMREAVRVYVKNRKK